MCSLDRLEEKLEGKSGRQNMPGFQLKQQKLSMEGLHGRVGVMWYQGPLVWTEQ